MVAIPLLRGIVASEAADFNISYPVNFEPVAAETGISNGYLRSAPGVDSELAGPGIDRGGILWNDVHYRVMGTKLVKVGSGAVTVLGDVGGNGPVTLDYGFNRLAIRSGTSLYYWDGLTLVQVTDPDLGPCLDMTWKDGYFVSTDGSSVIVTQLSDPTQINPSKYGSAESDPDMITGLLRQPNELVVFGRTTTEFHINVGGPNYPFQRNDGATIPYGCVAPSAKCRLEDGFAFVGSARDEALAVYRVRRGSGIEKISTRAIDDLLAKVADPTQILLERRAWRDETRLLVHLPDETLCFYANASRAAEAAVWTRLRSGMGLDKPYRPRNALLVGQDIWVGDANSAALGRISYDKATHFGEAVGWQFDSLMLYNQGRGGIVHNVELACLPGRHQAVPEPAAFFSYSLDGETYSLERINTLGKPFQRTKRIIWNPHKRFRNYLGLRFRGDSMAIHGIASLDVEIEALGA